LIDFLLYFDLSGLSMNLYTIKGLGPFLDHLVVLRVSRFFRDSLPYFRHKDPFGTTLEADLCESRFLSYKRELQQSYPSNPHYPSSYPLNIALCGACQGGNLDLVQILIKLGADYFDEALPETFLGTYNILENNCRPQSYLDIINYLIDLGNPDHRCWADCLSLASQAGNLDFVQLTIDHGACNWEDGLQRACLGGHRELIDFFIQQGADNWAQALNWASRNIYLGEHPNYSEDHYISIIQDLIQRGASNLDGALHEACWAGHLKIAKFLVSQGASDWNRGLLGACDSWQVSSFKPRVFLDLIKYMIECGATQCMYCDKPVQDHLLLFRKKYGKN